MAQGCGVCGHRQDSAAGSGGAGEVPSAHPDPGHLGRRLEGTAFPWSLQDSYECLPWAPTPHYDWAYLQGFGS